MGAGKLVGIILIAAGVFALIYGGFSYTRESRQAKIGPLELSVAKKDTIEVPTWAGVAGIVVGVALLVVGNRKG